MTPDHIRKAAVTIQKIRPDYSPMIEFYSQIFAAQAESLVHICPDPIIIEPALLALKKENEMPLISPVQFPIDLTAAKDLMKIVAELCVTHAPKLARAGEIIGNALDKKTLDLDALFNALLDSQSIEEIAKGLDLSSEALGFFGYTAMFPSIQACSSQLSAYLDKEADHNKGYCPVCGTAPDLSFLDESGKKFVTCSLCSHSWKVRRMGCLFCETKGKEDQHYFFSNEEKEYRVYYCEHCKNYLKTIDTRELKRRFVPRLEQVATLHLDIKAQEKGYTRVIDAPASL